MMIVIMKKVWKINYNGIIIIATEYFMLTPSHAETSCIIMDAIIGNFMELMGRYMYRCVFSLHVYRGADQPSLRLPVQAAQILLPGAPPTDQLLEQVSSWHRWHAEQGRGQDTCSCCIHLHWTNSDACLWKFNPKLSYPTSNSYNRS